MKLRGSIYVVRALLSCACTLLLPCASLPSLLGQQTSGAPLVAGFHSPPPGARLRCYWWWLNGHTTKATITRDLEEMAKKGYGGALLVDANGSGQNGNDNVPAGPKFGSAAWTELYVHALKEADRLHLEITLNIMSGWNLGGPGVKPEDASKLLTWSRVTVRSGQKGITRLPMPPTADEFYRQIAVLAYPLHHGAALAGDAASKRMALAKLQYKSASAEMNFSMPNTSALLTDTTPGSQDEDVDLAEVEDISKQVKEDGSVDWKVPANRNSEWEILRVGYTDSDTRVSTSSDTWQGLAIDYLDPHAFDLYWDTTVEPLLAAARPYVGKSLKYVATDSWELGGTNWTGSFREEFRKKRGYDPVSYLPIVAGRIIGSRELSTRFLSDLRRTVGDLVNGHYDRMAERAKVYGLGTQCESGGPHGAPFDALETFRNSAVPQTEYWAMSKEHRSADADRFFVKEASSAAHIYGKQLVAAEGMTSIGNQWSESIGMNLRPSFDQALTEGMNRLVWHEFTSSPPEMGLPGQEYFAGTHLNPNVTWWHDAGPFLEYLNRAQFLMQQGRPVSDVLYYYGDNVPNFVRLKADDPAKVLPGYDYDVTDTEALLRRVSFAGGELRTPEGIRYRALAMPASHMVPLAVLKFMERYVEEGGTLIGERPPSSQGISSEDEQREFQQIADQLWKTCEASAEHTATIGKGHLFCSASSRAALHSMKVKPDFEEVGDGPRSLDYIHRRTGDVEIYFIRNTQDRPVRTKVLLRAEHIAVELFHADTGTVDETLLFSPTEDGRTALPISLSARGSIFVILRHKSTLRYVTDIARDGIKVEAATTPLSVIVKDSQTLISAESPGNYDVAFSDGTHKSASVPQVEPIGVTGAWTLSFPPNWGAPAQVSLDSLRAWNAFDDPGIRYFSGRATYRATLHLTDAQTSAAARATLDLGVVHEVAAVRINGHAAGIAWKMPYTVTVDGLLHEGDNQIEVDVTNLWPNRLIGDAQDATAKHYTWTNIRAYTKDSPLLQSGIEGPVRILPSSEVLLH